MDGIDYGGVEVKSFEFGGNTGWDQALVYRFLGIHMILHTKMKYLN